MTSFVTKEKHEEMKAKFKELYGEIGGECIHKYNNQRRGLFRRGKPVH